MSYCQIGLGLRQGIRKVAPSAAKTRHVYGELAGFARIDALPLLSSLACFALYHSLPVAFQLKALACRAGPAFLQHIDALCQLLAIV